jgi:hypothetical protein
MTGGQEREEPYEATSLMYGSESAAGRATNPPTVTSSAGGVDALPDGTDRFSRSAAGDVQRTNRDPRAVQCW